VHGNELADATAPFSDAANVMFGGSWAGNLLAIAVIISGFGALNGWIMICAEMPLAARCCSASRSMPRNVAT
jgi:APA family basic amino acid/polyamine antiporter